MSYNNSDREFYYALYIKFHKEKVENILNLKLENIELDKNFSGRKIDLVSTLEDGRKLYMELQLNKSDNIHLEQLKSIINSKDINNTVIVWVAVEFKSCMLSDIEEEIKLSSKNIHFVALKLSEQVIPLLNILNNTFINNIIENLSILDEIKNHYNIEEIFYRLQNNKNNINTKKKIDDAFDLNKKEDVMKYLFVQLQKEIYYYPSIHRDKKLCNYVIVLAGGKSDVYYHIGLNRRNFLYVELRFGLKQSEVFDRLLVDEEYICNQLDYLAEFDVQNMKIGTYLYLRSNKRKLQIKQIARISDRYIKLFSPYLYPNILKID